MAGLLVAAGPATQVAGPQAATAYQAEFFSTSQPNTAFDMVRLTPGFSFDNGTVVRGYNGAAGNVLIDGERPATKDDDLQSILQRIPASAVARIELIRGGAGGIDMQGKTLLANVVRRQVGGAKITLEGSVTRWYDGRVGRDFHIDFSQQSGATRYEASVTAGRGLDDTAGNGRRVQRDAAGGLKQTFAEHNAGDPTTYKATGAIETPVAGGKLRVNATFASNPYTLLQLDHPLLVPGQDQIDRYSQNQKSAEAGLQYDRRLSAKARMETVLLQQFGRYGQMDDFSAAGQAAQFDLKKRTRESIFRAKFIFDPGPTVTLQAGVEGDYNVLRDHTTYQNNGTFVAVPAANVRVTERRGEGFATGIWRPSPALSIETGVRVETSKIAATGDVVSARGFSYAKPRAVLTWSPTLDDQVRLRLEREVGQLNFDDFAAGQAVLANSPVHVGNPNLTPQKAWVFEAAFEHKFWGGADGTVTYRHFALSDIIDRAPIYAGTNVFDAPGNIGSGRKDEVAVSLTLPTDKLRIARGVLTGQALWRWSSVTDPTTGLRRPISALHPAEAEIHFTQGLPKLKSTWGWDIYDQFRETSYRFNEIDTNQKKVFLSLFVDYKPRPDLSLRLEIEDATDRAYDYSRQIFAGPRGAGDVPATDIRTLRPGRGIYMRFRKTFG